jgi:hypothetical protein
MRPFRAGLALLVVCWEKAKQELTVLSQQQVGQERLEGVAHGRVGPPIDLASFRVRDVVTKAGQVHEVSRPVAVNG